MASLSLFSISLVALFRYLYQNHVLHAPFCRRVVIEPFMSLLNFATFFMNLRNALVNNFSYLEYFRFHIFNYFQFGTISVWHLGWTINYQSYWWVLWLLPHLFLSLNATNVIISYIWVILNTLLDWLLSSDCF